MMLCGRAGAPPARLTAMRPSQSLPDNSGQPVSGRSFNQSANGSFRPLSAIDPPRQSTGEQWNFELRR